jgi:hypothetical protein
MAAHLNPIKAFFMEYIELLKHPKWQKKRLQIMDRDEWTCRRCKDTESNLQIHHLYYNFDLQPWEYPDTALITLCELCHKKAEFMKWVIRYGCLELRKLGFQDDDIRDVKELVYRNISKNHHKESAIRYMDDIKLLMHG